MEAALSLSELCIYYTLAVNTRKPKHHCDPPVLTGACGGQVISGSLSSMLLTIGPVGH